VARWLDPQTFVLSGGVHARCSTVRSHNRGRPDKLLGSDAGHGQGAKGMAMQE
jgi:hypothetical protein